MENKTNKFNNSTTAVELVQAKIDALKNNLEQMLIDESNTPSDKCNNTAKREALNFYKFF